jgi:hypothetical protein
MTISGPGTARRIRVAISPPLTLPPRAERTRGSACHARGNAPLVARTRGERQARRVQVRSLGPGRTRLTAVRNASR